MGGKWQHVSEKIVGGEGVICGNLCTGQGKFLQYEIMWCRRCYADHKNDGFPKAVKTTGGDCEEDSEIRFERGCSEDHFLTHFQCDLCHLRNMQGR